MIDNGLLMSLKEFESLPKSKQLSCLYENQVNSNNGQQEILKLIGKYKLHQKIQYPWLAAVTTGMFFLIKSLIESA